MTYMELLRQYLERNLGPISDEEETLLEMIFDVYTECNGLDNDTIRRDFNVLYRAHERKEPM